MLNHSKKKIIVALSLFVAFIVSLSIDNSVVNVLFENVEALTKNYEDLKGNPFNYGARQMGVKKDTLNTSVIFGVTDYQLPTETSAGGKKSMYDKDAKQWDELEKCSNRSQTYATPKNEYCWSARGNSMFSPWLDCD